MPASYFQFVSTSRVLLTCFFATALFVAVIFPYLAAGLESLDARVNGYQYADVMAALEGYGEAGRRRYILVSLIVDTVFPAVYCSLYAGLIYRFAPTDGLRLLAYVPLIGGLCDIGENLQIVTMLAQYPDITAAQAEWAGRFTVTKFAFSRLSMGLAVAAMVFAVARAALLRSRTERD